MKDLNPSLLTLALIFVLVSPARGDEPAVFPSQVIVGEKLIEWTFNSGTEGWRAAHQCEIAATNGHLVVTPHGNDPYAITPVEIETITPLAIVRLRIGTSNDCLGELFWTTTDQPGWSGERGRGFQLQEGWHEYEVVLPVKGRLTNLRLDPGSGEGRVEVDWIRLLTARHHPLLISQLQTTADTLTCVLTNCGSSAQEVKVWDQSKPVPAGDQQTFTRHLQGKHPVEAIRVIAQAKGQPALERTAIALRNLPPATGLALPHPDSSIRIRAAEDGSGVFVERDGKLIAALAPLVQQDGRLPALRAKRLSETELVFEGEGLSVRLVAEGNTLAVDITSDRRVEGPIVRAFGDLQQGLFAGLEYLGREESSSSTKDIVTSEHFRLRPDPLQVTLPLMACITDAGTVAVSWQDMELQPTYAVPNFVDGPAGHRMSLEGKRIRARIRVDSSKDLTDAILWGVKAMGVLPPLGKAPRAESDQWALTLKALNGPLKGKEGWGHCIEPQYERRPYADIASTLWRLTGELPKLEALITGGAHIHNDAAYFASGRALAWLNLSRERARQTERHQAPDGSFPYRGDPKFRAGHYENTASGYCAAEALHLLDFAWATGDRQAQAAGLKALDYMKRFRTPRGAQTWELSLHTPDILACAQLTECYVRGFELTGDPAYLTEARRWAISGIPFVYLWGRYPIMEYATIPVYGASSFRQPVWFGLPVQWCGGVYAYALAQLAQHDTTIDWPHLARGILYTAERMQYPDGDQAGCLPDFFILRQQSRAGPSINPSALASLRLVLGGKLDALAATTVNGHRVLAPFSVRAEGNRARIEAVAGTKYQVIIDGQRVVEVKSEGVDKVAVER